MRRSLFVVFGVLMAAIATLAQQTSAPATHTLKATPKTIAWGYYDASAPPVLRVKSGDTVEIQTLITSSPKRLEEAGVPPEQVEQSLRDITKEVTNKGPGGHILTGPIYIEDAQPGAVLEVRIISVRLAIPYAYNGFAPGFDAEHLKQNTASLLINHMPLGQADVGTLTISEQRENLPIEQVPTCQPLFPVENKYHS